MSVIPVVPPRGWPRTSSPKTGRRAGEHRRCGPTRAASKSSTASRCSFSVPRSYSFLDRYGLFGPVRRVNGPTPHAAGRDETDRHDERDDADPLVDPQAGDGVGEVDTHPFDEEPAERVPGHVH